MSGIPIPLNMLPTAQPFTRTACLSDFFDCDDDKHNKYNKNHSYDSTIAKNQQEFGNRKRIKP